MPEDEWLRWIEFYKHYPFDDYHRFYRPAAHIAQSMGGGEIDDHLAWLEKRTRAAEFSEADLNALKAFGLKPPMRKG